MALEVRAKDALKKVAAEWLKEVAAGQADILRDPSDREIHISGLNVSGHVIEFSQSFSWFLPFVRRVEGQQTVVYQPGVASHLRWRLGLPAAGRHGGLEALPIEIQHIPGFLAASRPDAPMDGKYWRYGAVSQGHFENVRVDEPHSHDARFSGHVFVSTATYADIVSYHEAMSGIPGRAALTLAQTLYFSATTIVTLGLGDIVPFSTRARLLAASESILGIVLAGLFIHAATAPVGSVSDDT